MEPIDYPQYAMRQMHVLMQYEDGVTESERKVHLKSMEDEVRVLKADLKNTKADLVVVRGREKTLKDDLQEALKEVAKEKAKNKKLVKDAKDAKELADSLKLSKENAETQSDLRKENDDLRREVNLKRRDIESLSTELERANKRQRTGDNQPIASNSAPPSSGLNLDHLNKTIQLKSLSMTW